MEIVGDLRFSLMARFCEILLDSAKRRIYELDCHEFDKSNSRNDGLFYPPPLSPSAREGEFFVRSAESNQKNTNFAESKHRFCARFCEILTIHPSFF
ncbi:hypothetical protein [Helicobacter sp. 23-1045]